MNRYIVPYDEDFEPDSNNEVLKNYLNIKSKSVMEEAEEQELRRAELELLDIFLKDQQFKAEDVCNIHELWLGDLYPSAGRYRTVTLSKNGFPFASPEFIPSLMDKFEKQYLANHTPCQSSNLNDLAYALGVIHVELILIHPFREGNGRTARLLADLMVMQANRPPLNFASIDQTQDKEGFERYILAIQAGVSGNYNPIQEIFYRLLEESL